MPKSNQIKFWNVGQYQFPFSGCITKQKNRAFTSQPTLRTMQRSQDNGERSSEPIISAGDCFDVQTGVRFDVQTGDPLDPGGCESRVARFVVRTSCALGTAIVVPPSFSSSGMVAQYFFNTCFSAGRRMGLERK